MTQQELLAILGRLAREAEDEIQARWEALSSDYLSADERAELLERARSIDPGGVLGALTTPLSDEAQERLWRLLREALEADLPFGDGPGEKKRRGA